MGQIIGLALGGICIFVVAASVMLKVMPGPLKESDYFVIGSVATVVTLLVLFLILLATKWKSSDVFFKKRKRQR